jgi:hypothetical protein
MGATFFFFFLKKKQLDFIFLISFIIISVTEKISKKLFIDSFIFTPITMYIFICLASLYLIYFLFKELEYLYYKYKKYKQDMKTINEKSSNILMISNLITSIHFFHYIQFF